MHQVPSRVAGGTSVTSGQTEGSEVELHADRDELVQRVALVRGIGDHDLRRERIITGQSRDTNGFLTEEERGDDVRSSRQTTATGGVVDELVVLGGGASLTDKRVGLNNHAHNQHLLMVLKRVSTVR